MSDVLEGRADWVVVEGDCREALRAMPSGTVDLVEIDAHWATIARDRLRAVVQTTTSSTTSTNARQPDGPPTD